MARIVFRNASFDGQLARSLTAAYAGAADIGEVMAVAHSLRRPSGASWWQAWSALAARTRIAAAGRLAAGHRASACTSFLRASEYYRQAFYFVRRDLDDPRLREGYRGHVETFASAASLFTIHAEQVRIPYDDTTLHAWWFAPDGAGSARPTLLVPCGYDSAAESDWGFAGVPAALERGYNVLRFEGPGQGEALYTQRLYFRPDYEHVLTQVVDWAIARPDVRDDAIGLVGRSFAGYLAPRGATAEHRLAALVCDPAQPDMGARVPDGLVGRVAGPVVDAQSRVSAGRAEFFGARLAAHGLGSPHEYLLELRRYTMLAQAAEISCPTLIVEAEGDFAGGGGEALFDALRCPKVLLHLTKAQGADGHCGGLAQQLWFEDVYDWLDDILRP